MNTTCGIYTVRLRTDLPRDVACSYWAGPHADIVRRLPRVVEYNQHLFSAMDNGFWPATPTVGTIIPSSWRPDGLAEMRFENMLAVLRAPAHMRGILLDEQNVFEQVLGHLTRPGDGRWWTAGHDPTVGQRAVLLLRRRRGVSGRAFRAFVHEHLGPALHAGGARDLRTYTFLPSMAVPHPTPGVSHDNPPHRRYHAAVLLGAGSRGELDEIIRSAEVTGVVDEQHRACTAVHAFSIERTVGVTGKS